MHPPTDFSMPDSALQGSQQPIANLDFLWLEVTGRCNLECVHCYADSSPQFPVTDAMSYEKWLAVLTEGFELGCRKAQFIGGEPTLYPHLLQLIRNARSIGYEFLEVYTNGTLLNDDMFEVFSECNACLAFSVYGSQAGVHEEITKRKGSFVRTMENIRKAVNRGLLVRASIIEMSENIHDTDASMEVLRAIGVKSISTDRLRGIGRGKTSLHAEDPFQELCGACWRGQLVVDPFGDIFPCVFSRFHKLGNVSTGLRSILSDAKIKNFRAKVKAAADINAVCTPALNCKPSCEPYSQAVITPDRGIALESAQVPNRA